MSEILDFKPYRKRPIIIQAALLTEPADINTLEGTMHGNVGDYVIRGIAGEMYPIKADIFAKTYEPVLIEEEA